MTSLRKAGVERLDAVIDGGIHDEALVRQLAVGKLARDGVVLDGALGTAALAERLGRRAVSGVKVQVPGSAWVWPSVLNGVQPGDQAVVYAAIPEAAPFEVDLEGLGASSRQTIQTGVVERPLIERAMVSAELQRLTAERSAALDEGTRESLRQRIIAVSTKHRVLSDFTGLLILETDEDYARFHIDRQALADILTVGPTGVDLLDRNKPKVVAMEAAPAPADVREEAKKEVAGEERGRSHLAAPEPPPPPAAPAPRPRRRRPRPGPRGSAGRRPRTTKAAVRQGRRPPPLLAPAGHGRARSASRAGQGRARASSSSSSASAARRSEGPPALRGSGPPRSIRRRRRRRAAPAPAEAGDRVPIARSTGRRPPLPEPAGRAVELAGRLPGRRPGRGRRRTRSRASCSRAARPLTRTSSAT